MELDALIVADAVTTTPDGKVYIHGGGYSRYDVAQLPAPLPLGVLIRLRVDEADLGSTHSFRLTFIGPTGLPNIAPIEIAGTPDKGQQQLAAGEERFVHIALQLHPVAVRAGLYQLQLEIDGELARTLALPLVVSKQVPQSNEQHEWPLGKTPSVKRGPTAKDSGKAKPGGNTKQPPPPPKRKRRK
jgi:hypothetical protein